MCDSALDVALAWAGETFAKIGKREAALSAAREITQPSFSYQVYLAVAEAAAKNGQREEARRAANQALNAARAIEPDKSTIGDQRPKEALEQVAEVLAPVGLPDEALAQNRLRFL